MLRSRSAHSCSGAWSCTICSPACPTAPCCATGSARSWPAPAATAAWSRCCCSTWTASRTSTTRWAILPAIALLGTVAQRISAAVRATDTLARLGGDEFVLVQPQTRKVADVVALADKVLAILAEPFDLAGQEIHGSASIGIALFPQDGQDPDTLLQHAELALYRAKAQGRDQARFFEPAMDEEAQARRRLERELRLALQRGEFVLHYQPQLELATGRFAGVEALVRWHHPERGLVPPGEFIPAAEANGLIRPLGAWVLREACRQAKAWRGARLGPLGRGQPLAGPAAPQPVPAGDRRCARGGRPRAGPARARDHRRRADGERRADRLTASCAA